MRYWLLKSEPFKFAWADLVRLGHDHWDGIRNYQARNFMRQMQVGDQAFFYHSNVGLEIVGVCEITRTSYPDHTFTATPNPWEMVDVKPQYPLATPVTLKAIKANPKLNQMYLVQSMRLSVQPVRPEEWYEILHMAG